MLLKIQVSEYENKDGDLICAAQTLWCEVSSITSQRGENGHDIFTYILRECPLMIENFDKFCSSAYLTISENNALLCAIWGDETEDLQVSEVREELFPTVCFKKTMFDAIENKC
jgi:hypothetical protein